VKTGEVSRPDPLPTTLVSYNRGRGEKANGGPLAYVGEKKKLGIWAKGRVMKTIHGTDVHPTTEGEGGKRASGVSYFKISEGTMASRSSWPRRKLGACPRGASTPPRTRIGKGRRRHLRRCSLFSLTGRRSRPPPLGRWGGQKKHPDFPEPCSPVVRGKGRRKR